MTKQFQKTLLLSILKSSKPYLVHLNKHLNQKMMKIKFIYTSFPLLLILLSVSLQSQDRLLIDKIIARVGGETILLSEIESQYSFSLERIEEMNVEESEIRCQILESMIGQKLIVHQAKLDSVIVSDEEVNAQLDFRINTVLRQMNGDEAFFEEYYNMTTSEMRENLRDDMVQQILAEKMQNQLITDVSVTPQEVEDFFNSIPQDSLPFLGSEVELSEIVVVPEVNEIERLEALQKILKIKKQIDEGESFSDLAIKYSDDPGSGAKGGELGFATRGNFVPEFEAAAYSLEKDELSEPVETQFGFHIIQMQERRGNRLKLRHILIRPNITQEDIDIARAKLDTIKLTLDTATTLTFEEGVKKYSSEDVQSYNNGGRMQNPNTGKTIFQTSELPPEIYFAIEEMEIGDISEPLEFTLPTGETAFRITKLESRTQPHQANLEEDYGKIQTFAKENKKNKYFIEWVNEKIEETYIKIDRNYLSCPNIDNMIN